MLTFDAFREANVRRCEERFHPLDDWSPMDWGAATAGELGEMLNLVKKLRRGEAVDLDEIGREAADVVAYLDLLMARLGLDLGEWTARKFNEVSDRVGSDVRLPEEA